MKNLILSYFTFPATQLDLLDSIPVFGNIVFEVVFRKGTLHYIALRFLRGRQQY